MRPNTHCLCPEVFGKSHGLFQKGKKCTCKADLHPFFNNCIVILELYGPFFLPQFSLNSCFRQLPSLCGTGFREFLPLRNLRGLPCGAVVKNLLTKAAEVDSTHGSGRSPGEGDGNPLRYSFLEKPMDRGAWRAMVEGVTKSRT